MSFILSQYSFPHNILFWDTPITKETREELQKLICQALDQRERQTTANKQVYSRICGDFEPLLKQFDYTEPGEKHDEYVLCGYKIQTAVGALLRIIYKVKTVPSLPAEQEAHMRYFMRSVLDLMDELRNQQ